MKEEGLYPEKKKEKGLYSENKKERGLHPENNEGRKFKSGERKNPKSNSKVLGALQNSWSNSQTLRVATPPSENKKGRRSWEKF